MPGMRELRWTPTIPALIGVVALLAAVTAWYAASDGRLADDPIPGRSSRNSRSDGGARISEVTRPTPTAVQRRPGPGDRDARGPERTRRGTPDAEIDINHPSSDGAVGTYGGVRCQVAWDGTLRTLRYEDGKLLARGEFIDGLKVGLHEEWHPNGVISAIEQYVNNIPDGRFEYFDGDGNPLRTGSYVDGYKEGLWTEYWSPGQVRRRGEMLRGERSGHWSYYRGDGSVDQDRTGEYLDDELVR